MKKLTKRVLSVALAALALGLALSIPAAAADGLAWWEWIIAIPLLPLIIPGALIFGMGFVPLALPLLSFGALGSVMESFGLDLGLIMANLVDFLVSIFKSF